MKRRQSTSAGDDDLPRARLTAQQIARPAFTDPAALVAWMGAVQAQDPAGVRWAVGLRLAGHDISEPRIAQALTDGTVLRTHVLRWTWQLVAPADVRWMLSLVAPRLIARARPRHRELGLDPATFRRAQGVLAKALRGTHLTRDELSRALRGGGIAATGPRLSHLLAHAELEGVLCSGAKRDKQETWGLLDERVPSHLHASPADRTAALAELARRYLRGRGPATLADFVWWSGLTVTEARLGIEAANATIVARDGDGVAYFSSADPSPCPPSRSGSAPAVVLLPPFDEYLVGYRDRGAVLAADDARRVNAGGGMLSPSVVRDGRVIGTWRRTLAGAAAVAIAIRPFAPLPADDLAQVRAAAERYGAFLGRAVTVAFTKSWRPERR